VKELIIDIKIGSMTPEILAGLKYMREEEKLAIEVYSYFYEIYRLRIFSNIYKSE